MKKILIVNNNVHIGGVQKALVSLLWSIRDRYDITLLLFYPGGAYMDQIPPEVKVIHAGGFYRYIGMTRNDTKTLGDKLGRLVFGGISRVISRRLSVALMGLGQKKLTGFDVAISYLHSPGDRVFYGGCNEFVLRHVEAEKKVTFLHCDFSACGANTAKNAAVYEKFDAVAACSEGCASAFLRCHPQWKDRVRVVPNCYRFDQIQAMAVQASVEFPRNWVNILTVARLGWEKGVDRALEVLGDLKTDTTWCYHVVGNGVQMPLLRQMLREKGLEDRVRLYGEQGNPYGYMAAADLLWIPSRSEAAPLVIGEAAALGLPILSTETSSARDMVEKTGYGWVCENTREGMGSAISRLLSEPRLIRQRKEQLKRRAADNSQAIEAFDACIAGPIGNLPK